MNRFAKQILEKHKTEDTPLPKISSQKLNDYIKECCEKVEIKTLINIVTFIGGKPEEKSYPKCELITTHTARKTFLTNSIILGMNLYGGAWHKRI